MRERKKLLRFDENGVQATEPFGFFRFQFLNECGIQVSI